MKNLQNVMHAKEQKLFAVRVSLSVKDLSEKVSSLKLVEKTLPSKLGVVGRDIRDMINGVYVCTHVLTRFRVLPCLLHDLASRKDAITRSSFLSSFCLPCQSVILSDSNNPPIIRVPGYTGRFSPYCQEASAPT